MKQYRSESDHRSDEVTVLCAIAVVALIALVFLALGPEGYKLLAIPVRLFQ